MISSRSPGFSSRSMSCLHSDEERAHKNSGSEAVPIPSPIGGRTAEQTMERAHCVLRTDLRTAPDLALAQIHSSVFVFRQCAVSQVSAQSAVRFYYTPRKTTRPVSSAYAAPKTMRPRP